jgi:hypothetical protein
MASTVPRKKITDLVAFDIIMRSASGRLTAVVDSNKEFIHLQHSTTQSA